MCDLCPNLPELYKLSDFDNLVSFENEMYSIFIDNLVEDNLFLQRKKVSVKKYPMVFNRYQSFDHIVTKDYQNDGQRQPDIKRLERVHWIKEFIFLANNDFDICQNCNLFNIECSGFLSWEEPYRNNKRLYIFLEIEKYVVILEERKNYYLLITAFYIYYDNQIRKMKDKAKRAYNK